MTKPKALFEYLIRHADDTLILGQRLSEWCGHGPILEEDIALTNIALDLIGQATELYEYAAQVENKGRTADDLAFLRLEREYKNVLLVEQKNGDFGKTIVRQFLFDNFQLLNYTQLLNSSDAQVAAIAEKSLKEVKYHLKHSSEWVIRLGDGTEESHQRIQESVDDLMRFVEELFFQNEVNELLQEDKLIGDCEEFKQQFHQNVNNVLTEATLTIPDIKYHQKGGRKGIHSEHMGFLLAEMQYMQRTYPGMQW
ncbi:MAG: phenylacetate-CoA oxygenase subunit PaaC [Crocinitomicaceae bacterium]|nr:phenylacetate-CoA oxygenase subunit PaaC [Crocinitomicaceae bacterium]